MYYVLTIELLYHNTLGTLVFCIKHKVEYNYNSLSPVESNRTDDPVGALSITGILYRICIPVNNIPLLSDVHT